VEAAFFRVEELEGILLFFIEAIWIYLREIFVSSLLAGIFVSPERKRVKF